MDPFAAGTISDGKVIGGFFFFFRDADFLRDAQNIINTVLQTDAINNAIQAGSTLRTILSDFATVSVNPNINNLISLLLPRVEQGLRIGQLAERVRKVLLGSEDETLTPFNDKNGASLRTDGKDQSIYWQLQFLFNSKQDTADAVTMLQVENEIAKRLLNINTGGSSGGGGSGGGSTIETAALKAIEAAIQNIESDVTTLQSDQSSLKTTITSNSNNMRNYEGRLTSLLNELNTYKNSFNNLLPAINSIGPSLPDVSVTIWEEINKILQFIGRTEVHDFNAGTDKDFSTRLSDLDTLIKAVPLPDLRNQIVSASTRITNLATRIAQLEKSPDTQGGVNAEQVKQLHEAYTIAKSLAQVVGGLESDYSVSAKGVTDPSGNLVVNARQFWRKIQSLNSQMIIANNLLGIPVDQTTSMISDASQNILNRLKKLDEEVAKIGTGTGTAGATDAQYEALRNLYNNVVSDLNSMTLSLRKLNVAVGADFVRNFNSERGTSISDAIQSITNSYASLVTSIKTLETSIPSKKLDDIVGKTYVENFDLTSSPSIDTRLSNLERSTEVTSGVAPGRTHWYKNITETAYLVNVSDLDDATSLSGKDFTTWDSSHQSFINNRVCILPFDAIGIPDDPTSPDLPMWKRGALKIFKGKCNIAILLKFRFTQSAVFPSSLFYELKVQKANLESKTTYGTIAKDYKVLAKVSYLDKNSFYRKKDTAYVLHVFHLRSVTELPAALVTFNWKDSYPPYRSIFLEASLMYFAPIYYNAIGKPYMNPYPSPEQEQSHPLFPNDELTYFATKADDPDFLMQFTRIGLEEAIVYPSLFKEDKPYDHQPRKTLSDWSKRWLDDTIVKCNNQRMYSYLGQGYEMFSWWGSGLSTSGIVTVPGQVRLENSSPIRVFNHNATAGTGLFLFAASIPECMIFGLETHTISVDFHMLSLSGDPHMIIEVVGILDDHDERAVMGASEFTSVFALDDTWRINPFQSGTHDLQTGYLTDLKYAPSIKTRTLIRKECAISQISPSDLSYTDNNTRAGLNDSTKDAIQLKHNGLKSPTNFSVGRMPVIPDTQPDFKQLMICVYPKFYNLNYDFAMLPGIKFKFGNNGIVGEYIRSSAAGTLSTYYLGGDVDKYDI